MATITGTIIQILRGDSGVSSLVSDRIRSPVLKQSDKGPSVRVATKAGTSHNHTLGHSGLEEASVLVDAYADTPEKAATLQTAIFNALRDKRGTFFGMNVRSLLTNGVPTESSEASKVGADHDLYRSSRTYEAAYEI